MRFDHSVLLDAVFQEYFGGGKAEAGHGPLECAALFTMFRHFVHSDEDTRGAKCSIEDLGPFGDG